MNVSSLTVQPWLNEWRRKLRDGVKKQSIDLNMMICLEEKAIREIVLLAV